MFLLSILLPSTFPLPLCPPLSFARSGRRWRSSGCNLEDRDGCLPPVCCRRQLLRSPVLANSLHRDAVAPVQHPLYPTGEFQPPDASREHLFSSHGVSPCYATGSSWSCANDFHWYKLMWTWVGGSRPGRARKGVRIGGQCCPPMINPFLVLICHPPWPF